VVLRGAPPLAIIVPTPLLYKIRSPSSVLPVLFLAKPIWDEAAWVVRKRIRPCLHIYGR
jgi:hypothetical protein